MNAEIIPRQVKTHRLKCWLTSPQTDGDLAVDKPLHLFLFILNPSQKWSNTILFDLHEKISNWLHIGFPFMFKG